MKVDKTLNKLQKVGLSIGQNKVIGRGLSATNASGAAYKQGLYDGIKLMSEVNWISKVGGILDKADHGCDIET